MLKCVLTLIFFESIFCAYAQSPTSHLKLAKRAYENQDYIIAAKHYTAAGLKLKKNKSESLHAAISYYESGEVTKAIPILEYLSNNKKLKKTASRYLINAYKEAQLFPQAISALKNYYKSIKKNEIEKSEIKNEILLTSNAINYKKKEPAALVELIGGNINSAQDEWAIYPSINHPGQYYFSAIRNDNFGGKRTETGEVNEKTGKIRADIYTTKMENGNWTNPQFLNPLINSARHEEVAGFAKEGEVLLFYRYWNEGTGEIYLDSFASSAMALEYKLFESPLCSKIGDHDFYLFQDSIIIFSSNRLGGYGGNDLYLSIKRNGNWTEPRNLGATVNSPNDEISPYLAKDGHSLYFSSNNINSIGGFDIFRTKFKAESRIWQDIENLGIPVNSTSDEYNFRLNEDGVAGTFTSNRKMGCKGKRDIYIAYFKDELEEQAYMSNGSILGYMLDNRSDNFDISRYFDNKQEELTSTSKLLFRDYTIESIFYKDEDYLKDLKNKKQVDQIINILQINPELDIQIIGHAYEHGGSALNLYYSNKLTNPIRDYLLTKNIVDSRISQIGVGDYLPVSKTEVNGTHISTAEKWNNRIEFALITKDSSLVKLAYPDAPVAEIMKSNPMHSFRKSRTNLTYSIWIGESEQLLPNNLLNQKEVTCFVQKSNNNLKYQYYVGIFSSCKEAQRYIEKMGEQNNKNSKIIPFLQSVKLNRNEVINYVKKFPDLFYYIKYAKLD